MDAPGLLEVRRCGKSNAGSVVVTTQLRFWDRPLTTTRRGYDEVTHPPRHLRVDIRGAARCSDCRDASDGRGLLLVTAHLPRVRYRGRAERRRRPPLRNEPATGRQIMRGCLIATRIEALVRYRRRRPAAQRFRHRPSGGEASEAAAWSTVSPSRRSAPSSQEVAVIVQRVGEATRPSADGDEANRGMLLHEGGSAASRECDRPLGAVRPPPEASTSTSAGLGEESATGRRPR